MPLAAKKGDRVMGTCTHVVQVPTVGGPIPTPIPGHPFVGELDDGLSEDVLIENQPAAYKGSIAHNKPQHIAMGGPAFQPPLPRDEGSVEVGSSSVEINGKAAARTGDPATTCCIARTPGTVMVASSSVEIGG
jgi:uncharacterized Zn-binding protein involved in type VI secretion